MWIDGGKVGYFATSALKTLARSGFACPSCGGRRSVVVSRKYLVTTLRRCRHCALQFRAPTNTEASLERYYGERYSSGFTTELPDRDRLDGFLRDAFSGTHKDFSRYIDIVRALGAPEGGHILDLGCSWGYGTWQFRRAGYAASGIEIAADRAAFARTRLGVSVVSRLDDVKGTFDVIFAAHVLEHIPRLAPVLAFARERLRPNGLFVAVTPNGSPEFRARATARWDRLWGLKHPLFLDARFWLGGPAGLRFFVTSDLRDLDAMKGWSRSSAPSVGPLDGWELLAAFKPTGDREGG